MKVLITGFDPFGGESINPAYEAIKEMRSQIGDIEIVKLEISTVFRKSIQRLDESIEREIPDVGICVGQAGGRFDITIERVAINVDDGRIRDNEGYQPIDETIYEDGDNAYFTSLPIKTIVDEIKKENIPASVSNSAGTYVCNHVMYGLLYLIEKKYQDVRGGFIHVPFIIEQAIGKKNVPSMDVDSIKRALEIAVKVSCDVKKDKKLVGGSIC
jgi:pyroglutamyl-peptidase